MAKTFRLLSDEGLLGITYDPEKREFSVMEAVTKEGSGEGIKVLDVSASRGEPQDDSEPESEVRDSICKRKAVVQDRGDAEIILYPLFPRRVTLPVRMWSLKGIAVARKGRS